MRVVREPSELLEALERARSEAERSFGSADCILEKYVEAAKHVEMQVLGDRHGRAICLWERDCSVQRRHQKIVEETPCPWLSEDMRQRMAATAVRIVELIGYEGAGTVEFVVDVAAGAYYFLEVNARLQVEHPITEEVTGLDLVSLQLFVAAGSRLSSLPALTTIPRNGHAIECRLCAEDPTRNFLPERGIIRLWRPAPDTPDTRFETAIQSGSEVSIHFDPMIAKVVVWAPTRLLAVEKMIRTLAQTACVGVRTNQLFLQSCLAHRAFRNPAYTTSFIPENLDGLLRSPYGDEVQAEALRQLAPVAACLFLRHLRGRTRLAGPFKDVRRGFRNQRCDPVNRHVDVVVMERGATEKGEGKGEGAPPNASLRRPQVCIWQQATLDGAHRRDQDIYRFQYVALPPPVDDDAQTTPAKAVTARYNALSAAVRNTTSSSEAPTSQAVLHSLVRIPPPEGAARTDCLAATVSLAVDGRKLVAHLATRALDGLDDSQPGRPQRVWAHLPAVGTWAEYGVYGMLTWAEGLREEVVNASAEGGGAAVAGKRVIKAPMPCRVLGVLKKDGEEVKEGENAMVVESMKMEMSIVAPANGRFRTVWRKGDAVADGEILCRIE
ncbi:Biotin/lipoyl attachment [Macrophomina phaseolina MS6]|uniref:Biotin/lipoyl attachment n=1 Tax=Macrophomina phaseolina (strain MS6) TaxID=1126212 RepID=K2RPE3_MACPH|nr:Biotin/lipoyl attachment [Macrophomina phaseolina MS6]